MLIDLFGADAKFGGPSREAVRRCRAEGSLVACEIVWAEVTAGFAEDRQAEDSLRRLGVGYSAAGAEATVLAGRSWRAYRQGGGRRQRVIADFLVGAHAFTQAERLLSRDRGFYRRYFEALPILDPSQQ